MPFTYVALHTYEYTRAHTHVSGMRVSPARDTQQGDTAALLVHKVKSLIYTRPAPPRLAPQPNLADEQLEQV